ncbi:MAG: SpoIIE family protein phosphatase [Burkholderiales bacterium]|nr:SpoIIE family protein phosphatase [Bacteroidia bacterium]
MKLFFIILNFYIFVSISYSQTIEQLEQKLHTSTGADKTIVLKQLTELYKQGGNKLDEAYTLMELGDLQVKQGQLEVAITTFKKAEKNYEAIKDAKGMVVSANRIGSAFSKYGDYEQASTYLSKALAIATKNNMRSETAIIAKNLEVVNKNKKNVQKTATAFTQKKEIETVNKINSLVGQNAKSLHEISQLSIEAQLQELTIKAQQDEILRKKIDAENQKKEVENQKKINDLLKKEQEFEAIASQEKTRKQNMIIAGISIFAMLLTALCLLIYRNFHQKKKANNELAIKNEAINSQKVEIEKKNAVIIDSITYAKNIQQALLPSEEELQNAFNQHFVLYKPKDIVSGDFYWLNNTENMILFAVADCTGHGVPGAFVSMMGHAYLNEIVNTTKLPSIILNLLNQKILSELNKKTNETSSKYGMDIALIAIDKTSLQLKYAGAHNTLLIMRKKEHIILESDVRGIGTERMELFKSHIFQLQKNDIIYMNTDGFVDQKGGELNKKFLTKNFQKCLLQISDSNLEEQKYTLNNTIDDWRGSKTQMDDMLVVGIKI